MSATSSGPMAAMRASTSAALTDLPPAIQSAKLTVPGAGESASETIVFSSGVGTDAAASIPE